MPYDLEAVERGYGEVVAEYNGHPITLRYRADLDGRAVIAMKRAVAGVPMLFGTDRVPDTEMVISELVRVLLPADDGIPMEQRGWDLTRGGRAVAVTEAELMRLDPMLPVLMLGTIVRDVNDPNRRRPSLSGSPARAASPPIASPTSTDSSRITSFPTPPSGPSPASTTTPSSGPVGATG